MRGVDTNVLVRCFAQDDPLQSPVATRFIERTLSPGRPGHVSLVALAEFARVMRSVYRNTVPDIGRALMLLLDDRRFVVQHAGAVWAALDQAEGCTATVTFDRNAARTSGVRLLH